LTSVSLALRATQRAATAVCGQICEIDGPDNVCSGGDGGGGGGSGLFGEGNTTAEATCVGPVCDGVCAECVGAAAAASVGSGIHCSPHPRTLFRSRHEGHLDNALDNVAPQTCLPRQPIITHSQSLTVNLHLSLQYLPGPTRRAPWMCHWTPFAGPVGRRTRACARSASR